LFWEYDTRLGRRWNLDPKPQISISDYAAFGNSPIGYTDLLGDSKYKLNKSTGDISLSEKNKDDNDQIYSEDGKKNLQLSKGILQSKRTTEVKDGDPASATTGVAFSIDIYDSRNTADMKSMYEFVAKNSDVEWQLWNTGEGGVLPNSFLTTSHNENASAHPFNDHFFLGLTSHSHSHPGGNPAPSGSQVPLDMPQFRNQGDIGFVKSVKGYITNVVKSYNVAAALVEMKTLQLKLPKFTILTPNGAYNQYDENTYTDMGVIIKGKKGK